MTVRLAINGFGRTGRSFLRSTLLSSRDRGCGINDLGRRRRHLPNYSLVILCTAAPRTCVGGRRLGAQRRTPDRDTGRIRAEGAPLG